MGETTGVTSTAGMFAVLANTTMAVGDVAAKLASLIETGRLDKEKVVSSFVDLGTRENPKKR